MPAAPAVDSRDKKLGDLVVQKGFATQAQVDEAAGIRAKLAAAGAQKRSMAEILLQKGYVTKEQAQEVAKINQELKAQAFAAAGETKRRSKEDVEAAAVGDAKEAAVAVSKKPREAPPGELTAATLKLPGYEIISLLGKGGMGAVFKARQKSLDRVVALKVLSPDIARDETYLKRFTTEARALARLNHENIIAGIDVGEANGYRYFAMEYVEGDSLAAVIERDGALAEKRALTIVMQIARALVHADKSGLVHRDVKPQNIMIGRNDVAKLCDLGLAMTAEERKEARERGQSIGTPHYISPEQARGEHHVDIRSDIYSLGATLYHACTGETPFTGSSPMVLMTKHLTEEPVPPRKKNGRLSKAVNELVLRMMAKDKEKRYQTPIELLEDMERVLAGRGIEGGAASSGRAGRAGGKEERGGQGSGRSAGKAGRPAPAAKPKRPARDEGDDAAEGDEEGTEAEDTNRFKKPKKQDPMILGLISLFVVLVAGLIAFAMISAANNKKSEGPPPPSAQAEENGRISLENIRKAFNNKDLDKYGAIARLRELQGLFDRTKAAKEADEDIKRLEKMPLNETGDGPGAAAPADDEAPAATGGAKGGAGADGGHK